MKLITIIRRLTAGILVVGASMKPARADVVLEWNEAMTHCNESLPPPGTPPLELRAYAMAHLAMFNAMSEAQQNHANGDVAGAQAAHDVLARTLPAGTPAFDALLARHCAQVADGTAKVVGRQIGAKAAAAMLKTRAHDGAEHSLVPYHPGSKPGDYQFTAPFDVMAPPGRTAPYAEFPKFGEVTPFVLQNAAQFRSPPPYSVRDPDYVFDLNEVKLVGARNSAGRTPDQTEAAQFWYEMSAFGWNRIARTLAARQTDSPLDHARLFAALNAAMADALIAGWDTKYMYNFWRPVTAIHAAGRTDNNLTAADPGWEPLMLTPPMPDYVSTHAAQGAAASMVLIWFFHGDDHEFTFASTMAAAIPGLHPRTFHRISDAAVENALSRVWAGIHFRQSCLAGLTMGRSVGTWVVQHAAFAEGR